jgi:hypothetical protein
MSNTSSNSSIPLTQVAKHTRARNVLWQTTDGCSALPEPLQEPPARANPVMRYPSAAGFFLAGLAGLGTIRDVLAQLEDLNGRAQPWSTAMLADIYLLKLEAAVRAAKEAATSRFVPITIPAAKASSPAAYEQASIALLPACS